MGRVIGAWVLLLAASTALAQVPAPQVAAVQPPAWLLRNDLRQAVAPGAPLQPGDRLQTGVDGRLHLDLPDGSLVKLGAAADFELTLASRGDRLFRGALKVLKGAFRYSTRAIGALQRRDIEIHVGPTLTAGIRGTDLWGLSQDSGDLVYLIEGQIDLRSPHAPPRRLAEAGTAYQVPAGGSPEPPSRPSDSTVRGWIAQTELLDEEAALYAGGRHALVLGERANRATAEAQAARWSTQGYPVEVVAAPSEERVVYRLVLAGYGSAPEARRQAPRIAERLGLRTVQVLPPS